ncbi:MAG: tRNA adenosine(34) deaminase TadA [Longicatena sp.]
MHEKYMKEALKEANKALLIDEVPIGCVIVKNDKIIARAHNLRETKQQSINHAEILAIQKACKKIDSWRLEDCSIYVTLEPCAMCAGAILQSRIDTVIFGALDPKGGCIESCIQMYEYPGFNHYPKVITGIMREECSNLISNFFRNKRKIKKVKQVF